MIAKPMSYFASISNNIKQFFTRRSESSEAKYAFLIDNDEIEFLEYLIDCLYEYIKYNDFKEFVTSIAYEVTGNEYSSAIIAFTQTQDISKTKDLIIPEKHRKILYKLIIIIEEKFEKILEIMIQNNYRFDFNERTSELFEYAIFQENLRISGML